MRDKDLRAAILGVKAPWSLLEAQLQPAAQEVEVFLEHGGSEGIGCPQCGPPCGRNDMRQRSWRYNDTCH